LAVRGLLRRYMAKMTGRSRAQATRLVGQYMKNSEVKETVYRRNRFESRFTQAEIELPAKVDEAHETLSGAAAVENAGKPKAGFATALGNRSPIPAFSTAPITATLSRKTLTKTKEGSPRFALAVFFRTLVMIQDEAERPTFLSPVLVF
jgi:hypothetical protein